MQLSFRSAKQRKEDKQTRIRDANLKLQDWHSVYAWKPKRISDTKVVWLEQYWRRNTAPPHRPTPVFTYRTEDEHIMSQLKGMK